MQATTFQLKDFRERLRRISMFQSLEDICIHSKAVQRIPCKVWLRGAWWPANRLHELKLRTGNQWRNRYDVTVLVELLPSASESLAEGEGQSQELERLWVGSTQIDYA